MENGRPAYVTSVSQSNVADGWRERRRDGGCVIDVRTGDLVHWLWLQGIVRELYDVVVLPGVRRPSALGVKTDEIRGTITIGNLPLREESR